VQNERALLQARLQVIYGQVNTTNIERDFIGLAIKWNASDSTSNVEECSLHNDTVYTAKNDDSGGEGADVCLLRMDLLRFTLGYKIYTSILKGLI